MSQDKEFYGKFFAVMAGLAVLAIVLIYTAIYLGSDVSDYKPEEIVLENIKPVGEVYVAGESEPPAAEAPVAAAPEAPTMVADAGAGGQQSAEELYNSKCMACHAAGVAGAPKLGDTAAWTSRIAAGMDAMVSNGIAAGMDAMVSNAINGLNAMPPKGTCMSCSDEDIRNIVQYMAEKSQ